MSETFYNLTIARNIQLSRNEKEKSPQTLDEIQLPQRESENDRPITERLDWRGGDIRDFYPVYVFAAAVDEGRRVVLGGEGCRTVSTAAPSDDDIAERERG